MELRDLSDILNTVVGNTGKLSDPSVSLNLGRCQCSRGDLLEGFFYVFVPGNRTLQKAVKWLMEKYVEDKGLHLVVTAQERCKGNWECRGHYVDPFKVTVGNEHLFIDKFPEDINGTYVHFLTAEGYKTFEEARKK